MFLLVMAVITVFVLIGYIEIVPLVRAAQVKELILYSCIFLAALVVCLLLIINIKLPSPAKPMDDLIKVVFKISAS